MLNPTINKSITEFLVIQNKKYKNLKIQCIYIEKYNSYYIIVEKIIFKNKEFTNDFWEFENKFINNFPSNTLIAYSEEDTNELFIDYIEIYSNYALLEEV